MQVYGVAEISDVSADQCEVRFLACQDRMEILRGFDASMEVRSCNYLQREASNAIDA